MKDSIIIVPHSEEWAAIYEAEAQAIREVFDSTLLDIQHIGSTSVPDLLAKPIIDIAVQIQSYKDADDFIMPLAKLGYVYKPELSSGERHFFQKGDPTQFHLSVSYLDQGGYWQRQILFRDYLMTHADARREYEQIKLNSTDKTEFVQKILALAGER